MLDKIESSFNECDNLNKLSMNQTGFLSITVSNRLNNRPVSFAEVSVYRLNITGVYGERGEANLIARRVTDENGKVPLIELPVIRSPDIISSGQNLPTSNYFITFRHFRYYPVNLMNVLIYPNITTSYNVLLTPLTSLRPRRYDYIITPPGILNKRQYI